jgi:hypothetical protein
LLFEDFDELFVEIRMALRASAVPNYVCRESMGAVGLFAHKPDGVIAVAEEHHFHGDPAPFFVGMHIANLALFLFLRRLMLSGKLRKEGPMKRAILTASFLLLASSANAEFDTGNDLYKYCTAPAADYFSKGMCFGLTSGYFDSFHLAYKCEQETPQITRQQIRDIVMKALMDAPAKRHLPAFMLAGAAFSDAFVCESWVGSGPQKK